MHGRRIAVPLLLVTFLAAAAVVPQQDAPAPHSYAYDLTRQQTLTGIVTETRDYKCPVSGTVGSHITVKTDVAVMEVHLGPASFMKQYEITIRNGDHVSIVGSRITFAGKPALIARSVTVERETFNFRDAKGTPLW